MKPSAAAASSGDIALGEKKRKSKDKPRVKTRQVIRRLWPYIWKYRRWAILVLIFGALSAALQKGMYLAIEPLTDILFPSEERTQPIELPATQTFHDLKRPLLDFLGLDGSMQDPAGKRSTVLALALMVAFVSIFASTSQFLFVVLTRRVGLGMIVDLRNDIARHLLRQSLSYHSGRHKGDTISRMSNDAQVTLRMFNLVFQEILQEPLFLILNLCIALYAAPLLTLYLFILMPLIALPMAILGRKVRKGSRGSLSALGESTSVLTEMLSGIRVVKAFRMEDKEAEAFDRTNQNFVRKTMRMVRARAMSQSVQLLMAFAGLALVIVALAHVQLTDDPKDQVFKNKEQFMVFLAAFGTTFNHVKRLSKAYNTVQESMGAAERLFEILDVQTAIQEQPGARKLKALERGITFQGVHFAYESEPTIQDFDLDIPVGSRIALVGLSGAGKSTVLDLIARFYDPVRGSILVDGQDLRSIDLESWLARVAIVTQHPFLFHTTVENNIRYARQEVTEEQVHAAARAAAIHDFIAGLPDGYETMVGEDGTRLSGGQLQRITIARAILKQPDVLLLDEATSSLDVESEAAVHAALENLMEGRTSIIVAHRLSTIRSADLIVVMEKGHIVERGQHEELYRAGGTYRRLYEQFEGGNGPGRAEQPRLES